MSNPTSVVTMMAVLLAFAGASVVATRRRSRQDRRKILADGTTAQAFVTGVIALRNGECSVKFSFHPSIAAAAVEGKQKTTQAAIDKTGISVGSTVQVRYLPNWPASAFADTLTRAERLASIESASPDAVANGSNSATLFFVAYDERDRPIDRLAYSGKRYAWIGDGDVVITGRDVRFTAQQRRTFWFRKTITRQVALNSITNVESLGTTLRLEVLEPGGEPLSVQFRTVNSAEAETMARMLPSTKNQHFVPALAERAAFEAALLSVTPNAPVTPGLIGINVVMFAIAASLGGGLLIADPQVMIRLGTNYTPLTLAGQWWRLLSSTFLHFGVAHLVFNMWVLYVNGRVAERLFGNLRYLVIYLVAGVSGSVASLWWHPIVNGAGASGAIFGVLGALLAFFLKSNTRVPRSVIKPQLTSVGIFVVYSLLNGARHGGIDNAAHIGGLIAGFCMGFLLARPLEADRDAKPWTAQWATAIAVSGSAALLVAYQLATGNLIPRVARDGSGNPIPLEGLTLSTRSLGGVRLRMTAVELLSAKGPPIRRDESGWVYNSIDSTHNGVLSVVFSGGIPNADRIAEIEFFGDQAAAPTEMPYLGSLTPDAVVLRYGQPIKRTGDQQTTFLWFRNGIMVGVVDDKVARYGIFDLAIGN